MNERFSDFVKTHLPENAMSTRDLVKAYSDAGYRNVPTTMRAARIIRAIDGVYVFEERVHDKPRLWIMDGEGSSIGEVSSAKAELSQTGIDSGDRNHS